MLCVGPSNISAEVTASQTAVDQSGQDVGRDASSQSSFRISSNGVTNNNEPSRAAATYADATRKPTILSAPLKQAVVSAVYADLQKKKIDAQRTSLFQDYHILPFQTSCLSKVFAKLSLVSHLIL